MFGSAILDLAIGLVFIFFLLSSIAFHINEFIARFFNWRAKELEAAVHRMLESDALTHALFEHRLVGAAGLAHGGEDLATHLHEGHGPSYIDPKMFALALFDTVLPEPDQPRPAETARPLLQQLDPTVVPESLQRTLLAIINDADETLDGIRKGAEDWFNATMERLSGVYRRRLMVVNLVTAASLTLVIGVDTIAIASALWQQQDIRAVVAGAGGQAATGGGGVDDALSALRQLGLPLGWTTQPDGPTARSLKVIGLGISILAVSLGAPFWFDLLKQVSNLRATGPAPHPDDAHKPQAGH